jgi:hypothetical protein
MCQVKRGKYAVPRQLLTRTKLMQKLSTASSLGQILCGANAVNIKNAAHKSSNENDEISGSHQQESCRGVCDGRRDHCHCGTSGVRPQPWRRCRCECSAAIKRKFQYFGVRSALDLSPNQLNAIKIEPVGSYLFPVEKEAVQPGIRVYPGVYLTWANPLFLAVLASNEISNLRAINQV